MQPHVDLRGPYAPPQAEIRDMDEQQSLEFYVVAPRKFLILFFFTLGLYQFYWFYKHWSCYRAWHREPMWPVARAIFAIFFMHSLNREIEDSLSKSHAAHRWMPTACATGYVVFQVTSSVFDRLSARSIGSPTTDIVSLVLLLPVGWLLHASQKAANLACGDPAGRRNARLGFANYVWITLGGLLWGLALIGLTIPAEALA